VFGRRYWELQRHAYLFCAPTGVGGTHPVILEAMAAGNCVLVNDHPPNAETVGDAGIYFSGQAGADSLAQQLECLLGDEPLVARYRERARHRAQQYSWDAVTDEYERLLTAVFDAPRPGRLPASLLDAEPAIAG
jgi:glycosyltransferase involved in cell wall biosynthesis